MGTSTAVLMPNGKVLINPDMSVAELYDPADNSMAERSFNTFRQFPAAALLPNGKVLIAGGGAISGVINTTQIYDPSQDTFADGPSMSSANWAATAAPTADGKVLVIGGSAGGTSALSGIEVYDSVTNSFTAGAPMSDPRLFLTATLLPNGGVLIAGGWNGTNSLKSTDLHALKVSTSRWAQWSARAAYAVALGAVISLAEALDRGSATPHPVR